VPKLGIQVYGRGGSRRAGEQAAAKLALEVAEQALLKSPPAGRKTKPRAAQLKLAGIATVQTTEAKVADGEPSPPPAKAANK
jgi:ribonuclease-3